MKMSASAAAASPALRFSSATPPLAPFHRPLRRRLPSVRCSLAAAPGVRAPPELVDSILSKVTLTPVASCLLPGPFPDSCFMLCFCCLASFVCCEKLGFFRRSDSYRYILVCDSVGMLNAMSQSGSGAQLGTDRLRELTEECCCLKMGTRKWLMSRCSWGITA